MLGSAVLCVALVGGACSDSEPQAAAAVEEVDATGVSDADVIAGVQAEQAQIRQCMEDAGWPYVEPAADDLVVTPDERGPGWGMAQSLLDAIDGEGQQQPDNAARRAGVAPSSQEAWYRQVNECAEDAAADAQRRYDAAAGAQARLDSAWEEFYAGSEYAAAIDAWAACMTAAGYAFEHPDEPGVTIRNQMRTFIEEAQGDPTAMDRAAILAYQQEEVTLHEADQACRVDTLDPVELEFKTALLSEERDAVEALRRATRGDG